MVNSRCEVLGRMKASNEGTRMKAPSNEGTIAAAKYGRSSRVSLTVTTWQTILRSTARAGANHCGLLHRPLSDTSSLQAHVSPETVAKPVYDGVIGEKPPVTTVCTAV